MKRRLHMGLWLVLGWVPLLIGTTVAAAPQAWQARLGAPGLVMAAGTVLAIAVLLWPRRNAKAVEEAG